MEITPQRISHSLRELALTLQQAGLPFAIAGAHAVAIHGHVRATQDVDALIAANDAERADQLMRQLGYRQVHRSAGVATYVRSPLKALAGLEERCDLLLASRELGLQAITLAAQHPLRWQDLALPVVPLQSLILMKLIAIAADPLRPNDRADVQALLVLHRQQLDLPALRADAKSLDPSLATELDALISSSGVAEASRPYRTDIGGF